MTIHKQMCRLIEEQQSGKQTAIAFCDQHQISFGNKEGATHLLGPCPLGIGPDEGLWWESGKQSLDLYSEPI